MKKKLVGVIVAVSMVFGGTAASAELNKTELTGPVTTQVVDPGTGGR